jgi:hypothetical protein
MARNILNRIGSTPFLQAAKLGDVEYMRLLLAHGADASITTEEGATPLMAAAGVGIWQVGESAGSNEDVFEAVKICYERGNDVNAVDVNGETALHGAAHRGSNEIVKFLVEKGAKMDVPNKLGWTPWITPTASSIPIPTTGVSRRPNCWSSWARTPRSARGVPRIYARTRRPRRLRHSSPERP